MGFYRIFNIIYKLFSKRGRKAIIITLVIISIIFIFTGKVFAVEDDNIVDLSTLNLFSNDFQNYYFKINGSEWGVYGSGLQVGDGSQSTNLFNNTYTYCQDKNLQFGVDVTSTTDFPIECNVVADTQASVTGLYYHYLPSGFFYLLPFTQSNPKNNPIYLIRFDEIPTIRFSW